MASHPATWEVQRTSVEPKVILVGTGKPHSQPPSVANSELLIGHEARSSSTPDTQYQSVL